MFCGIFPISVEFPGFNRAICYPVSERPVRACFGTVIESPFDLAMQAVPLRAEAGEASLEGGPERRAIRQQGKHQHGRVVGGRE